MLVLRLIRKLTGIRIGFFADSVEGNDGRESCQDQVPVNFD